MTQQRPAETVEPEVLRALLARLKKAFREVKHVKPPASRSESVELYVVATGFKPTEK